MDVQSEMDQGEGSGSEMGEDNAMSDVEQEEDEEEWKGIGGDAATLPEEHFSGKKSSKPPTGEELRAIKDASDLFKSSSFKLQVRNLFSLTIHPC